MEKEIELLHCPFCGSKAEIKERDVLGDDTTPFYEVWCTNKGCYLEEGADYLFETREDAAKKWNESIKLIT